MPRDWSEALLRDVAHVYSGGTPSRAVSRYWGGEIPWVTTAEIDSVYITDSREKVTYEGLNASAAKLAEPGTLLLAMYGQGKTRGKVAILRIAASMNQACAAIEAGGKLDENYLLHFLTARYSIIRGMSNAGGQDNLSGDIVKSIAVAVPPLAEQRAIGEVLSDADDLLAALEGQIAKKRDVKQGMMQELLTGRSRLPGFTDDWHSRTLGEVLTYRQPTQYLVKSTDYVESGTPVLTAGKSFVLGYTTEAQGLYSSVPVVIFDDFTTSSKYVTFPFKAKSSAMKMLSPKPGVDLRWVHERMQIIDFAAVDHKRRWISEYSKIRIDLPPFTEQKAVASALQDADVEIEALERRLESARAVKVGMMQKLLTGRTRLPVEEEA